MRDSIVIIVRDGIVIIVRDGIVIIVRESVVIDMMYKYEDLNTGRHRHRMCARDSLLSYTSTGVIALLFSLDMIKTLKYFGVHTVLFEVHTVLFEVHTVFFSVFFQTFFLRLQNSNSHKSKYR